MLAIKISFLYLIYMAEGHLNEDLLSISITRQNKGDVFNVQGEKYPKELCAGLSGGTAEASEENEFECRCQNQHPVYRDDLNVCVDDIQECSLVPFVSGTSIKKIPYVFLPLKGQIVYPSAEIVVSESGSPVCVVSGGQYLGRNGWMNLRNNSDTEPPFRLFRDEGRTYLQWFGESSMRMAMEGRIILVHLMCKDASFPEEPRIFTPCIAFRVAGNPSVREVMFAADVQLTPEHNTGLSKREYVAIGLCSLFLAIVYVASIFLYMHWRKQRQRKNKKKIDEDTQLTLGEEGIVKNNPLLQANRHLGVCEEDNGGYMTDSNSCGSDPDRISDLLCLDEDEVATHQNVQTSAIVHPCDLAYGETTLNQDPNSIERLPEENVSIIETLESKEVHPETIKAIVSANGRRKLYFNPSYFEPELLKAPPPAALEFLVKIREVIAIAKHKMSNKKFSPSLLGIPEEEGSLKTESNAMGRNVGSVIEEKTRQEPLADTKTENKKSANGDGVDKNEFCCSSDAKQKIIQRWLEDVPVMMSKSVQGEKSNQSAKQNLTENKVLKKSEFWQTNETVNQTAKQENKNGVWPKKQRRPSTKTRPPPLPPQQSTAPKINREKPVRVPKTDGEETKTIHVSNGKNHEEDDKISGDFSSNIPSPEQSSPSSPNETSNNVKEGEDGTSAAKQQETIQSLQNPTKNLMDAVIQELTGIKKPKKLYNEDTKQPSNSTKNKEDWLQKWECSCENINEFTETKKSKTETENKITDNKTKDSIKIINKRNLETVRDNNLNNNNNNNSSSNNNEDNNKIKNNNNNSHNFSEVVRNGQMKKANHSNGTQDEHEYEIILLNGEVQVPNQTKKNTKGYNLSEVFSKSKRNEGYSLVSEVYVSDGNNSCEGESPTTKLSNPAAQETEKISYEVMNEKTSRLTIHVKDSPRENKEALSESDNFEPDTLERKQGKCKSVQRIENESDTFDRYSNQRFHDLDRRKKGNGSENNENFTDSLERPTILLKTNGSFKRNSLEKDVNELFRNLNWARMENFGSLREIYEAKSRNHRRRTETTSLIDSVNSESDCISTLSWSEERRNKLLHRGIVLHIDEDIRGQTKGRHSHSKSPFKPSLPSRSDPKPQVSRSQILFAPKTSTNDLSVSPLRSPSPPVPPPRSLPVSPEPHNGRSTTPSPVNGIEGRKTARDTPSPPLPFSSLSSFTSVSNNANNNNNNTVVRVFTKSECGAQCHSFLGSSVPKAPVTPPRPPKVSLITASSPPLPPRSSKPPLPPKNSKSRSKKESSKFASRPLPPLPLPRPNKNSDFPKDLETLSTLSGASADSLNSSEYESFYTLPYEGEEEADWKVKNEVTCLNNPSKNFSQSNRMAEASMTGSMVSTKHQQRKPIGHQSKSQRIHDPEKKSLRKRIKAAQNKVEDSGYLSTDSSESYCPQILLPSHIPRIPEGVESSGGQNSETEESICDGASESGAESTATDSFFYGHFNKGNGAETQSKSPGSQVYSYSLRLSDVEVNSDTERHCVPIMVRP